MVLREKKIALQQDFIPMMSATLEKAARNVLIDLLFTLTKRQEDQSKIASPVQKVGSNWIILFKMLSISLESPIIVHKFKLSKI